MPRILLFIIFLMFSINAHSEERDLFKDSKFDLDSAVPADKLMALQEILIRNIPVKPLQIITVCRNNHVWCEGYITAVIHKLSEDKVEFCLPTNDVGRHNDEAIKSIVESWLYRQPTKTEIRFSEAVHQALTEHKEC